ncbi:hypothetical protein [Ruthenibacterium lactatiformans]|uniref:hypothetical protein n=1 Tax=Ruthenibacterium lactatiformans TaxID=1550024 RepID=UPI0039A1931E
MGAGKIADAAIVASMDRDHYTQVMKALELGYRPAGKAHFPESRRVHGHPAPRRREKLHVVVCHVLRYTPFFSRIGNH